MSAPRFITFTGADDATSIEGMVELSSRYPVEWGILFSGSHVGESRFPSAGFVERLVERSNLLTLSAHLCGSYSRDVLQKGETTLDGLIREHFPRAQINTSDPLANPDTVAQWADDTGSIAPIMQFRGTEFPTRPRVFWLFDASGGRGTEPQEWPKPYGVQHASKIKKGYAGGLNPDNVEGHVEKIGHFDSNYWIDMETGVRDENDRFSLDRCLRVCAAVYGSAS